MTIAHRHITPPVRLREILTANPIFSPCPLTLAGQSEQKQGRTEDTFVAR